MAFETCTPVNNNDINPKLIYFNGEDIYNALKELMTKPL